MKDKKPTKKITYFELNNQLTETISQLQRDDIDIDVALELYQRGQEIIKQLNDYLTTAENKIVKIKAENSKA